MQMKAKGFAAASLLTTLVCNAFAAGPVYDVACLDCTAGKSLMPMAIAPTGAVVATDAATCDFPDGCMQGQGYVIDNGSITPTPSFDVGAKGSTVMDINGSNKVVGKMPHSDYPQGPFGYVWDGVTLTDLGDAINHYGDMYWSHGTGINDLGHIVGTASGGYHDAEIFIFKNGLMSVVPRPPESYINGVFTVMRVNNKDHVVGTAFASLDDHREAFISKNGVTQQLAPNSYRAQAYAINASDAVAGYMRVDGAGGVHNEWPVIWKKTTTKLLNTLQGFNDHGHAHDINDFGWVVGDTCSVSACTPFVYNGKKMFDLNTRLAPSGTGWILQHATGINNSGAIVGIGTFNHELHAFKATPTTAEAAR